MIDLDQNKINLLLKTINGFFPNFNYLFKTLKDPRVIKKNTYHLTIMLWAGLFMFILKLGSTRNINFRLKKTS